MLSNGKQRGQRYREMCILLTRLYISNSESVIDGCGNPFLVYTSYEDVEPEVLNSTNKRWKRRRCAKDKCKHTWQTLLSVEIRNLPALTQNQLSHLTS